MSTWTRIVSICHQKHLRCGRWRYPTNCRSCRCNRGRLVDSLRVDQKSTFDFTVFRSRLLLQGKYCLCGLLGQIWLLVVLNWTQHNILRLRYLPHRFLLLPFRRLSKKNIWPLALGLCSTWVVRDLWAAILLWLYFLPSGLCPTHTSTGTFERGLLMSATCWIIVCLERLSARCALRLLVNWPLILVMIIVPWATRSTRGTSYEIWIFKDKVIVIQIGLVLLLCAIVVRVNLEYTAR